MQSSFVEFVLATRQKRYTVRKMVSIGILSLALRFAKGSTRVFVVRCFEATAFGTSTWLSSDASRGTALLQSYQLYQSVFLTVQQ